MRFGRYKSYLQYELNRSAHTVRSYLSDLDAFAAFVEREGLPGSAPSAHDTAPSTHVGNNARSEILETDSPYGKPEADRPWGVEIDSRTVRQWLASLGRLGQTPASLKRRASAVSGYFRYLQRLGVVSVNPVDDVPLAKLPPRLPRFVRTDSMEHVLEDADRFVKDCEGAELPVRHIAVRDALVIELLYATGMRRSELVSITDRDFNPARSELLLHGKGGKDRVVPLPATLVNRIRQYITLRDELFPGTRVAHLLRGKNGGTLNQTTLSIIVKEQLASTRAEHPTPHLLRHSFATAMLSGGADINAVKELLGHANLDATQVYTHVTLPQLKDEYRKAHPRAKDIE